MAKNLTLVTGDQLFKNHFTLSTDNDILMVESAVEAKRHSYHKLKITYIYTCMRHYRDFLVSMGKKVHYFELQENKDFEVAIKDLNKDNNYQKIEFYNFSNKFFDVKIKQIIDKLQLTFQKYDNPMFLTNGVDFKNYLDSLPSEPTLRMSDFYIWQRKRLGILVDHKLRPTGGKWSFDSQNRKKLPKAIEFTQDLDYYESKHFYNVKDFVEKNFSDNPGNIDAIWLPVTHTQAEKRFQSFLENTIREFGDFEDAMTTHNDFAFHSVLSPLLNIGLLTPQYVLDTLFSFLEKQPYVLENHLNSIEGFVRQIIGWREWVKGMYDHKYNENFLELNFFDSKNTLPEYFYFPSNYSQELENNLPLKTVLLKVERLAWAHHIERLMIVANWMTINEYSPRECYNWFISQFVDGFEWVMVANVMGMGLFADGGMFASKPYISGGNYIKKMSDFKDSDKWGPVWTSKFWDFIYKHEKVFENQPRLSMLLERQNNAKKKDLT